MNWTFLWLLLSCCPNTASSLLLPKQCKLITILEAKCFQLQIQLRTLLTEDETFYGQIRICKLGQELEAFRDHNTEWRPSDHSAKGNPGRTRPQQSSHFRKIRMKKRYPDLSTTSQIFLNSPSDDFLSLLNANWSVSIWPMTAPKVKSLSGVVDQLHQLLKVSWPPNTDGLRMQVKAIYPWARGLFS